MEWLLSEIKIGWAYTVINLRESAAERASFVMQIIGMALNNVAFIVVWILFIDVFGNLNGWGAAEVIALQGYNAFIFGLAFTFAGGLMPLRGMILNGGFDSLLLSPRALLTRAFTLDIRTSAIGDLLYGVICVGIYIYLIGGGWYHALMLTMFAVPAFLIFVSILLISSSVAFFIADSEDLSRSIFELFFAPSMYPSGGFQGMARFLLTFVIPSITVAGLPIELLSNFSWFWFAVIWILAFVWPCIAYWFFLQGLKRYESGNTIGARV